VYIHSMNEVLYWQYYQLHIILTLLWHVLKVVGCSLLYQSSCDSSVISGSVQYITLPYCMHDCKRNYTVHKWRPHLTSTYIHTITYKFLYSFLLWTEPNPFSVAHECCVMNIHNPPLYDYIGAHASTVHTLLVWLTSHLWVEGQRSWRQPHEHQYMDHVKKILVVLASRYILKGVGCKQTVVLRVCIKMYTTYVLYKNVRYIIM